MFIYFIFMIQIALRHTFFLVFAAVVFKFLALFVFYQLFFVRFVLQLITKQLFGQKQWQALYKKKMNEHFDRIEK